MRFGGFAVVWGTLLSTFLGEKRFGGFAAVFVEYASPPLGGTEGGLVVLRFLC